MSKDAIAVANSPIIFNADSDHSAQRSSAETRLHVALCLLHGLEGEVADDDEALHDAIEAASAVQFRL